jgi:tetratricopeptide (TPR) repeat protein
MVSDQEDARKELFKLYDQKLDELYTFRDKYYIVNENSTNPDDRNQDLLVKLNDLASELEAIDNSKFESLSSHLVLIGRAFNVLPEYNPKAFDSLTKAIKLDPKSMEAWNYLGECYWKRRDFLMCKNCFEHALTISKNKRSLRGLSMVKRQLVNVPANKEQFHSNHQQHSSHEMSKHDHIRNLLDESVKYAKDAVQMDAKDGMSWYILANCYVAKFFRYVNKLFAFKFFFIQL